MQKNRYNKETKTNVKTKDAERRENSRMYGIPDSVKPLSAAEEQVMLAVWACRAPATRRDIDEKLRAKGWVPATMCPP